jgi:hypothetical protein
MKKLIKLIPLLLLSLLLALSSCETENYDTRNHIIGYYDYEIKAYIDNGNELTYIGNEEGLYDVVGTCKIEKNWEYSDAIDIWDNGELILQGFNVREVENSIVFDMYLQEYWLGAIPVTVRGIDYWKVGNKLYHGAYLFHDESVEIALAAEVMDVSSDLVLLFIAYKH